jgi:hypothetical protein
MMVTKIQLTQFVILLSQGVYLVMTDCVQPRVAGWYMVVQCTVFLALFGDFFVKTYLSRGKGQAHATTKKLA